MDVRADEELVARIPIASVDEANALWEELASRHEPLLRTIAGRVRIDCLDLCSGLFAHLKGSDGTWGRLAGFRSAGGAPFRNWLAVVASRVASGMHEPSLAVAPCLEESPAPDDPEGEAVSRIAVLGAIARLKHSECRVLLRRHYWNVESFEELSPSLGRSAPALRQMHRRNLRELRELMAIDG